MTEKKKAGIDIPIYPTGTTFPYSYLQNENDWKIEVSEPIKNVKIANINTFQEPKMPLLISYDIVTKQYNNIQEQLSELTKTNSQLRKELEETRKKKDEVIADLTDTAVELTKEKDQLKRKLARSKAKAKSYKDELNIKDGLVGARADIDDLQDRMRRAEDVLHIKEEGI